MWEHSLAERYYFFIVQIEFLPFPPPLPTTPAFPTPFPVSKPPLLLSRVLNNCSCKPFTLFPYNPLPSPLWSLPACSQFRCLWLYFACLFILLIRFLQKDIIVQLYFCLPPISWCFIPILKMPKILISPFVSSLESEIWRDIKVQVIQTKTQLMT